MFTLAALIALGPFSADRPEIVLADFESPTYGAWAAAGDAFGDGPAKGALPGQMAVGDYRGERLVNSFSGGDDSTGTLTSPEFAVDRKFVRFLIGGGRFPGETSMDLMVDGRAVRTATGHDSEFLREESWDVSEFAGKSATLVIRDTRKGGWGHVNVDHVVLCDSVPPAPDERETLLARAEESVEAAAARVANDPLRPTFHVLPPANWLNDPNGPLFYKGDYHLFFQHNPYGEDWGNMHWAHVRSKDLVRWERLPIALWPSKRAGEDHVFSGCATIGPDGRPMLFYTSIGPRKPEQWAAVPEGDDLIKWKKHPANPIMTEDLHGDTKVHEWRDPFVFHVKGKPFMVLGGNLNASKGGQGVVMAYRAENDALTKWKSLGVLFRHPDAEVKNIECPLFFPLGDKWVLIVSQGRPVQWFVGSLDEATMRFTAETRGVADAGHFYAPNVFADAKGRTILWGWVPDFPKGRGWNGCMTLPRVVTLGEGNRLRFEPAPELDTLRDAAGARPFSARIDEGGQVVAGMRGEALEIDADLRPGGEGPIGLRVRRSADGRRSVPITYDPAAARLDVGGSSLALETLDRAGPLRLRVFVDHSIVEVYASTGQVVTKVYPGEAGDSGVEVFANGRGNSVKLESWPVGSIWSGK